MPVIEYEGKTTQEAIETASTQLRIPKDELKFEIISTGSGRILGFLAGKKAKIKVFVHEKFSGRPSSTQQENDPGFGSREPSRSRSPNRSREFNEPDRGARRRNERRSRTDGHPRGDSPRQNPTSPVLLAPTTPAPGEEVVEGAQTEFMTSARDLLCGILERMDIEAQVRVTRISDRVILDIQGQNTGLLIGKKGATLDALQFLLNKCLNRAREDSGRIIVDTESYRERRHQSLIGLAERMAAKALRSRRPVNVNALSAHDRRVVHLALKERADVFTKSKGEGSFKKVVIIPAGGPGRRSSGGEPRRAEPAPGPSEQRSMPTRQAPKSRATSFLDIEPFVIEDDDDE